MAKKSNAKKILIEIPDIDKAFASPAVESVKNCDIVVAVGEQWISAWSVSLEGAPFDRSHFKPQDGGFVGTFPNFPVQGQLNVAIMGTGPLGARLGARVYVDNAAKGTILARVEKGISCRAEANYVV